MAGRVVELTFRGNNRSAIKALDGIAERSQKTSKTIKRDNETAAGSFKKVGESAGRVHGAVAGLAGTIGLGGLAFGIKSVVTAGMAWQTQQAQLQGALKNTGQMSASTLRQLNEAADKLSSHGGFGAAESVHSLTQLVTATGSATTAIRDTTLATDIARRTGRDFGQVTKALALAEQGHTTGLTRLGIAIPKVTTAEDALKQARASGRDQLLTLVAAGYKFTAAQKAQYALGHQITPGMLAQAKAQDAITTKQQVFATLQQKFAGASDRFSRTTAGRLSDLKNRWTQLQEKLGSGLLPVMNKIVGVVSTLVDWLDKHRVVLYGLLAVTGAVVSILTAHAVITGILDAKTYALAGAQRLLGLTSGEVAAGEGAATAATTGLGLAMDALPVLALIAGLVLLVTHFQQAKEGAIIMWHGIESAAVSAWHGIELVATRIWNALTWPFRAAEGAIKGIMNSILGVVRWVVNKVVTLWNDSPLGGSFNAVVSLLHGDVLGAGKAWVRGETFGLVHYASGGVVKPRYFDMGGPVGTDTIPGWLSPGEGVVNRAAMGRIGSSGLNALNSGAGLGGNVVIEPAPFEIRLDSAVIYRGMVHFARKQAARGPSSLVGGGMLTGART